MLWRGLIEHGRACSCFHGVSNRWRCERVSFNQSFHSTALAEPSHRRHRLWTLTPIASEPTTPFVADRSLFAFLLCLICSSSFLKSSKSRKCQTLNPRNNNTAVSREQLKVQTLQHGGGSLWRWATARPPPWNR